VAAEEGYADSCCCTEVLGAERSERGGGLMAAEAPVSCRPAGLLDKAPPLHGVGGGELLFGQVGGGSGSHGSWVVQVPLSAPGHNAAFRVLNKGHEQGPEKGCLYQTTTSLYSSTRPLSVPVYCLVSSFACIGDKTSGTAFAPRKISHRARLVTALDDCQRRGISGICHRAR